MKDFLLWTDQYIFSILKLMYLFIFIIKSQNFEYLLIIERLFIIFKNEISTWEQFEYSLIIKEIF